MLILCSGNPFVNAYLQSDGFGRGVFWVLISLSVISWIVLLQKLWMYICVKRSTAEFSKLFSEKDPLGLQFPKPIRGALVKLPHPLFDVYRAFKTKALAITYRGHFFTGNKMFTSDDLDLLASELDVAVSLQVKKFEKHLFVLSTVVTLGPFIGLLGTVWGILMSFSQMQGRYAGEGMLAGLSLALATTVLGLVVAIPALIGYNYFKNALREFRCDMGDFAHLLLTSTELHYKAGEHAPQTNPAP